VLTLSFVGSSGESLVFRPTVGPSGKEFWILRVTPTATAITTRTTAPAIIIILRLRIGPLSRVGFSTILTDVAMRVGSWAISRKGSEETCEPKDLSIPAITSAGWRFGGFSTSVGPSSDTSLAWLAEPLFCSVIRFSFAKYLSWLIVMLSREGRAIASPLIKEDFLSCLPSANALESPTASVGLDTGDNFDGFFSSWAPSHLSGVEADFFWDEMAFAKATFFS